MARRKSRQSTHAPVNIDFDYCGDSGQFSHLIKKREGIVGNTTTDQLNFEMKLRGYKNTTEYSAEQPWAYPANK